MCERGVTDSREYVKVALDNVKNKGYRVNNAGVTIEGEKPKMLPWMGEMKRSIAAMLEVGEEAVGISATTGEGLTAFGRGEGIQAMVIVSVMRNEKN